MNGPYETGEENLIEYLRQLEDQNAHHADRKSLEWIEYQSVVDALGIIPNIVRESDGATWNDHTQSWEIIGTTPRQEAHDLVQRRLRTASFSRQYGDYRATVQYRDDARGLPIGVHDPADVDIPDVGTHDGGDGGKRPVRSVRGHEAESDGTAESGE